ncbi:hypothetical protein IQ268_18620 [Oculatella sp. LEGE 06141]|uniref:hypothetical protein n=1 Tax=Oculatella sp. LEGE 06141 TaxID=1828648 RepID=UPI0018808D74|nr:hypothetical protein [Oculatella sp. LEGE 06141]MBE9180579.1 hypothetical protein [Oculatella sp. LEGE 06141]
MTNAILYQICQWMYGQVFFYCHVVRLKANDVLQFHLFVVKLSPMTEPIKRAIALLPFGTWKSDRSLSNVKLQ